MVLLIENNPGWRRRAIPVVLSTVILLYALAPPAAAQEDSKKPKPPVNLNTASVAELARLPGVGQVIARRIVRHREKSGPFRKVDELLVIRGISQTKLEKLHPLITVGKESPLEEKKPD